MCGNTAGMPSIDLSCKGLLQAFRTGVVVLACLNLGLGFRLLLGSLISLSRGRIGGEGCNGHQHNACHCAKDGGQRGAARLCSPPLLPLQAWQPLSWLALQMLHTTKLCLRP